jgi:plasmid maintenance system killer protein
MALMDYLLRWVDRSAKEKWLALKTSTTEDKQLYDSMSRTFEKLKRNPYRGDRIKKERIPKSFKTKYGLDNLLKININQYWRLLYFIEAYDENTVLVILLDFMPHPEYDRLFGYN